MTENGAKRRWARGFFRAWVALSVVWLALVSVVTYADYPTADGVNFHDYEESVREYSLDVFRAKAMELDAVGQPRKAAILRAYYNSEILEAIAKAEAAGRTDLANRLRPYLSVQPGASDIGDTVGTESLGLAARWVLVEAAAQEDIAQIEEHQNYVLKRWVAAALIPPFVLLACGFLGAWVLRGFRSGGAT